MHAPRGHRTHHQHHHHHRHSHSIRSPANEGTLFPGSGDNNNNNHLVSLHSNEECRREMKPGKLERGLLTSIDKTVTAMTSLKGCWYKFSNRLRDYIDVVDSYYRPADDVTDSAGKFDQETNTVTRQRQLQDENCKTHRHKSHSKSSLVQHQHKQYDPSSRLYNCSGIIGLGRAGDESHRSTSKRHSGEHRTPSSRSLLPPGFCKRKTSDGQIFFMDSQGGKHWFDPTVPKELLAASLDMNLDLIVGRLSSNWEIRQTPSGKIYYVDHIKRTTQFTDPRLVAYKDELMKYLTRTKFASLTSNNHNSSNSPIVLSSSHRLSNGQASSASHSQQESCPNYTKRGHDMSSHSSRSHTTATASHSTSLRRAHSPQQNSVSQSTQLARQNLSASPATLLRNRHQNANLMRGSLHNLSTTTQVTEADVTGGTLNRNSIAQLKHNRQKQHQQAILESATLNPSQASHSDHHHYEQISQTLPRNSGSVANLPTPNANSTNTTTSSLLNCTPYTNASPVNDTSLDQQQQQQRHSNQQNSSYHQQQTKNNRELFDKISILRQELLKQQVLTHPCRIDIKRKQLFDDSFRVLSQMTSRDLKKRLLVKFRGEEGLDYGGVAREWFYLLSRKMLNPMCGLFQYTSDDIYNLQINPDSGIVYREHLQYFKFCGRILGMAAFHGHFIEGHFTKPFYKMLLRRSITLGDIENVDPELHRSLCWILDNDITNVIDTTFLVQHNALGELQEYELKENGRNIMVTEENKHEYVNLYVNYRCRRGIDNQFEALQRGFNELISPSLVENFNENELELLIGGLSRIDIEDWRLHTKLKNCTVESPLVRWFWDIVKTYDEDRRARLLQFVTGSPRVPIQGFKALQGVNSESRLFTIHLIKNACTDNLPKSHTCFNRIDLPPYETYEKLRDKLTQAIEETMGFAMQ